MAGLKDTGVLLGHGGDINELQFHPKELHLLLSASAGGKQGSSLSII